MEMIYLVMYILLCAAIVGFLVSGMLTILQLGGIMKPKRVRFMPLLIFFAGISVILMGAMIVIIRLNT